MGTFTSKYKVNDGTLWGRTETRIDAGKSIDAGASAFMVLVASTIGLWFSGFLWIIYSTLKNPSNISYKDMQEYGIDTKPILEAKTQAWSSMFFSIIVLPLSFFIGWYLYSRVKSNLKPLLDITKEFNNKFIQTYNYVIDQKRQIIDNSASVHGRDSEEYKKIAELELNNLLTSIQEEFFYNTTIMKAIEDKSKRLLNINFPFTSVLDIKDEEEIDLCSQYKYDVSITNKYLSNKYYKIPLNNIEDMSIDQKKRSKLKLLFGIILLAVSLSIVLFIGSNLYHDISVGAKTKVDSFWLMIILFSLLVSLIGIFFIRKPRIFTLAVQMQNKILNIITNNRKTVIQSLLDCVDEAKAI